MIKERIVEKRYVPGQRIVIDQLARELKTSSIPVREAIRQLEAEGLLEYKQNVGPVVLQINEAEYYDSLNLLAVLEGYATALSAENFSPEKILELREKNERMKEALSNFDIITFAKLNIEFHDLIYEECPNKMVVTTIRNLWKRLDSIRGIGSTFYLERVKESIKEHEQIISLIENKASFHEIETAIRLHKYRTAEDFSKNRLKAGV